MALKKQQKMVVNNIENYQFRITSVRKILNINWQMKRSGEEHKQILSETVADKRDVLEIV